MIQKSYNKSDVGKFYLVPTPIGNLEDITLRGIKILENASLILAEDTRVTKQLLNHLNIKKDIKSCYKYNELGNITAVLDVLRDGKDVAYVSDRGTPLISDPGFLMTKELIKNNVDVIALPGACAFLPALNMSGIEANNFLFFGFLNSKVTLAKKELEILKRINYVTILYEAPHRFIKTINLINDVYGNVNISVSREISKMYEEVFRGSVLEAIDYYKDIKGEFVIIIDKTITKEEFNYEKMFNDISILINKGLSTKDAIYEVSKNNGVSKNLLYNKYKER